MLKSVEEAAALQQRDRHGMPSASIIKEEVVGAGYAGRLARLRQTERNVGGLGGVDPFSAVIDQGMRSAPHR